MRAIHLNEHFSPGECYKATGCPQDSEFAFSPSSQMKNLQKHMYLDSSLMTLPPRGILCIAYSGERRQQVAPRMLTNNNCYLNSHFLLQTKLYWAPTINPPNEGKPKIFQRCRWGAVGQQLKPFPLPRTVSVLQLKDVCGDKHLMLRTQWHIILKTREGGEWGCTSGTVQSDLMCWISSGHAGLHAGGAEFMSSETTQYHKPHDLSAGNWKSCFKMHSTSE